MVKNANLGVVLNSLGRPPLADVVETLARYRAHPSVSCLARLGDSHARGVVFRLPADKAPRVSRYFADTYNATTFAPARRQPGNRWALTAVGENRLGNLARVATGVCEAGGGIDRLDARVFDGGVGPKLFVIDMVVQTPAGVGLEDLLRRMMRRTRGDPMRVFARATGRTLAVREVGGPDRGAAGRPAPGPDRRVVLVSNSRNQAGIVAGVGNFLAARGASVERATGYTIAGRFVLLVQAACGPAAFGAVMTDYRRDLAEYGAMLTGCHWSAVEPAAGEVGYRLAVDELDDVKGVSPLWRVRDAADRHRVTLGRMDMEFYDGPWFGTPMARVKAIARGPAAAAAGFAAEVKQWEGGGVGVDLDPTAEQFKHEGELDRPLRLIVPRASDEWYKTFEDV
ncbi:MAG TPA: hypothetical protein VH092_36210 [Urbifossiella sp.]|jgi:hypothetical protein|nr:hypothetical protein [Urbifossiella sp.]